MMLTALLSTCLLTPLDLPDAQPYDQISWLCSHNAMSNKEEKWLFPNQLWGIEQQLDRGIHAQMWDIWLYEGEPYLRHGNGTLFDLGKRSLRSACDALTHYLQQHPRAIITLILESKVDEQHIRSALHRSGALPYLYRHPHSQSWPTLGELRRSNKRLIIFSDRSSQHLLPLWQHAVETDWVNKDIDAMSNKLRRGKRENALFILNHFVSNPLPSLRAARQLNSLPMLQQRMSEIQRLYKRSANFLTLDFIGCAAATNFISDHYSTLLQRKDNQEQRTPSHGQSKATQSPRSSD